MTSYSLGNILLSNVGNLVHSVYVFHLPVGPVWVLHSFYLVSTGLMLVWYLRYAPHRVPHRGERTWLILPTRRCRPSAVNVAAISPLWRFGR